jgi:hypothetical protein
LKKTSRNNFQFNAKNSHSTQKRFALSSTKLSAIQTCVNFRYKILNHAGLPIIKQPTQFTRDCKSIIYLAKKRNTAFNKQRKNSFNYLKNNPECCNIPYSSRFLGEFFHRAVFPT